MGAAGVKRESATVVMDRCRKQIEKLDYDDRRAVVSYLTRKFPDVEQPKQAALTGLA